MAATFSRTWIRVFAIGGLAAVAYFGWLELQAPGLPEGIAGSNGRIEAVEIDVASKGPGRVMDILVNEGDFLSAGDVLARMDTAVLKAQLREAEAQHRQAVIGVGTAESFVKQREAELNAALAVVQQRKAELDAASKQVKRTEALQARGTSSVQQLDEDRARFEGARAAVSASEAQVAAANAALGNAKSQIVSAEALVEAAQATVERIQADLDDSVLKAPRDGRVQYRVVQPGEVVAAGGAVLNMVDLSDVYMTFFLPTSDAGRVALGAEARIVLDAAPEYVIPARISYVADVAQFTPKTVETEDERQKLTFRLKAQIDRTLLVKYLRQVKTGLPGMAYVRMDASQEWPPGLQVKLPE